MFGSGDKASNHYEADHMLARTKNGVLQLLGGMALCGLMAAGGVSFLSGSPARAAAATVAIAPQTVKITFKNGTVIEGVLVEETDGWIKVQVKRAIGTATETYLKSEIDRIEKIDGGSAPAPSQPKNDAPASAPSPAAPGAPAKPAATIDPGATKVYVINFKGEFGQDVTATPVKAAVSDAKKLGADIILIKIDCTYTYRGQQRDEYNPADAGAAFNQLETVRQVGTLLTDDIRDDPEWKSNTPTGKPRLVVWVKKALGGVAFMPFISPEIYYTSDGRHGGIGYLERIFGSTGDEVVRQKQYSLRLARAEGLAIKGGHEEKLIRAMSRSDYVLSVSFVGGKPVYFEDMTGDELLTDDGNEEAGRRDTMEQIVRFEGNDVLMLDSKKAQRLGLSVGTADTLEDLAFELGVSRNYAVLPGRSDKIFEGWSRDVKDAEQQLQKIFRDFQRVQVQGNTPEERNRGRGQQIRLLEDAKKLLERYGEGINPRAIQGAPEQWEVQINQIIEQIKQQIRLDKRR